MGGKHWTQQNLDPSLRMHVRFQEQRVRGGLVLSAHLPGIDVDDVHVTRDGKKRTLTVQGIRHLQTWLGTSYRWFKQDFEIPSSLDLDSAQLTWEDQTLSSLSFGTSLPSAPIPKTQTAQSL